MTVRAECMRCGLLVELADTEENRKDVEDAARYHARRTGHRVRVLVLEVLWEHVCEIEVELESRDPQNGNDRRRPPDFDPNSGHAA